MADISADTVGVTGGATRAIQSKLYEYVSVLDYVLPTDPSGNFTNAFTRALATGKSVYVPASPNYYLITDYLTIATPGQVIFGDTGGSRIAVDGNFPLSRPGVIVIDPACSERNSGLDGIEIFFSQPAGLTSRSGLIQYPWAIYAPDVTRLKFGHVRIAGAWNGMCLNGNTGGLLADIIEIGCYNQGIASSGALDWWNVGTMTFWPFGCTYQNFYEDTANLAAWFGRIDGLNVRTLNVLSSQIVIADSDGTTGFGTIGMLSLDADARLDFLNGNYNIVSWYATSKSDQYSIHVGGGAVTFGPGRLLQHPSSTINPAILVNGGTANFGPMICDTSTSTYYTVLHTGGSLLMDAPVFLLNGGNRTHPYVGCLGGRISFRHAKFPDVGSSTGNAFSVASDEWHDVVINQLVGWPVLLPASKIWGTYVLQGVKQ